MKKNCANCQSYRIDELYEAKKCHNSKAYSFGVFMSPGNNCVNYEIKESVIEYCSCPNKPINPIYHVPCNVCDKPHKEEQE